MSTRIGATIVTALIAGTLLQLIAQASKPASEPSVVHYTADNRLDFPSNYREWVFLSAGRGMTYGPSANPNGPPLFDNVFVNPAAYREFVKSGRWPDKSVFVLEIRSAAIEGSINRGGQFQRDLVAVEVEVKDAQKFADSDGWAYFGFGNTREPAGQVPKTQDGHSCHGNNTATEHTFVQFYPTVIDIAKTHKTFREDTGLGK